MSAVKRSTSECEDNGGGNVGWGHDGIHACGALLAFRDVTGNEIHEVVCERAKSAMRMLGFQGGGGAAVGKGLDGTKGSQICFSFVRVYEVESIENEVEPTIFISMQVDSIATSLLLPALKGSGRVTTITAGLFCYIPVPLLHITAIHLTYWPPVSYRIYKYSNTRD